MKKNQIISNFKLKEVKNIKSRNAQAFVFEHIILGTELLYIKTEDPEFFYSVGFYTPAVSDKGLTHILEHSVLAGSENFQVKDPFVQLLKSSHFSYLNAVTYPEFTAYPVGSTNEQSFKKLMHVYTDAVFKPLIVKEKGIFLQEGWRYEKKENGKWGISGVVFNEMRAAMSTHDRMFEDYYLKTLFKGNTLGNMSAGDPRQIINLTHDEMVAYYKKYYHPSNARIMLHGNITNLEYYLKFLDTQYLNTFTKAKRLKPKKVTSITKPIRKKIEMYAPQDKTYSTGMVTVCPVKNYKKQLMRDFVAYVLGDKKYGLLYKYMTVSGLVEDVDIFHESALTANTFVVRAVARKTIQM